MFVENKPNVFSRLAVGFEDRVTFTDWKKNDSVKQESHEKLVIIQSTPICNMNCNYCYLPVEDRQGKNIQNPLINDNTLKHIYRVLFDSQILKDGFDLVWHAGEPMAAGLKFYKRAFSLINEMNHNNVSVNQGMQTNGTLINQEWAEFIKENNVSIGISIDGPKFIHDKNRIFANDNGSFNRVMRGIRTLQRNEIDFAVIAVLTKESLDYPDAIMNFFKNENIQRVCFNVEESEGMHNSKLSHDAELVDKYRKFFSRIVEIYEENNKRPSIREIEHMSRRLKHGSTNLKSTTNVPLDIINFDYMGNVSTFSPELLTMMHPKYGRMIFGNVRTMRNIEDILNDEKFAAIRDEIKVGVNRCRSECQYFVICGGGHPSNKLAEHGTLKATETLTCRLTVKENAEITLSYLQGILRDKHSDFLEYPKLRAPVIVA